jgi:hypothetical protein
MRKIVAVAMRMDNMKILCAVPFKDKTLTGLDVSGKKLGTEGALVVAEYLDGNRALSKLFFGGDEYWNGDDYVTPEPATLELGMAEANLSNKGLQAAGAIIVAAWISHKDNGALNKLDISNNNIGAEHERDLQRICVAGGIELAR